MKIDTFVTVVVPCRNEKRYIKACLDSILAQDYPKDDLEVLVVDGMSNDKTRAIVEEYAMAYPFIRLLDNPRKITPCALNIGIRMARGNIIIRMDAHATYDAEYIKNCVEALDKTGADNVGGPMRAIGANYQSRAIACAHSSFFGLGGGKFHDMTFEGNVDTVYLGCWRKTIFEKYGVFDERLARNQDSEYNARIRKNGGKIFLTPEIKSYYYCRSNLKDLWIQNFRTGIWNIKTIKIVPGSLSLRHFIPLFFVIGLLTTWIIPWLWLGIVISYLLCSLFFSLRIAVTNGVTYFFIMPLVFLTLHLSYGFGLLAGVFLSKTRAA